MTVVARFCFGCQQATERADCRLCRACATKICTAHRDALWEADGPFRGMLHICAEMKEDAPERVVALAQRERRLYQYYNNA